MKLRLSRSRTIAVTAVAAGLVLAVAVPAGAAVQLQSESPAASVKIAKNAKLKAGGAGAVLTITVVCASGNLFDVNASLYEKVGAVTTGGTIYMQSQLCTGSAQKVKVPINASPRAFRAGTAFATASIAPGYTGDSVHTQREVTLAG